MKNGFFEDFEVGETIRTGGVTMTEGDIIDYALKYDPQPIHTDREAAKGSIYGGIIASGWQVGALAFRMFVQAGVFAGGSMGSPGVETMRWHKPVRPGDTVRLEATIAEMRPSSTRDDRGYMLFDYKVLNQANEVVMSWLGTQIVRRRPGTST